MRLRKNARQIRSRGGDTIIEVIVSAIILLLAMAVLQGAVTFSQKALNKNYKARENYSAMMKALPGTASTNDENKKAKYVFYAVGSSGAKGNPVFYVETGLGTKKVSFMDTENSLSAMTFNVYTAASEVSGG